MASSHQSPQQLRLLRLCVTAMLCLAFVPAAVAQSKPSAVLHHQAPEVTSRNVITHKAVRLSSLRGKVVLLNFWATWCAPCLTEMPIFNEWQKEFGAASFQVIGISMDDEPSEVVSTITRLKLAYPVLMGDEHIATAYGGVLGLPVSFLIDRQGKVQARYDSPAIPDLRREIQRILKLR